MDGYTIDKSLLSKEEQQSLFQGLQILQATKYPNAEMAMNKLVLFSEMPSNLSGLMLIFHTGEVKKQKKSKSLIYNWPFSPSMLSRFSTSILN